MNYVGESFNNLGTNSMNNIFENSNLVELDSNELNQVDGGFVVSLLIASSAACGGILASATASAISGIASYNLGCLG